MEENSVRAFEWVGLVVVLVLAAGALSLFGVHLLGWLNHGVPGRVAALGGEPEIGFGYFAHSLLM